MRSLKRGDDPEQVMRLLSKSLSAKYLHGPLEMMRGTESERRAIGEVVERLLPAAD
jgi:glutamyl-tRNA reductase